MIKERISLSGDLKSKVKQLMIYAGWYEGRKVDISIASQYYAERGVPMMKSTQRFYHKYFGLCCQWYFSGGMKRAADFEFGLFPYLINGIKDHLEDTYFRNMSGAELDEIEQIAGEQCQPIGQIGYYYPAPVSYTHLYPGLHPLMERYARLAMRQYEQYTNLSDEQCALPGSFAVFALGMLGQAWRQLLWDYLDLCDDEHSHLQEKFLREYVKQFGFTADRCV